MLSSLRPSPPGSRLKRLSRARCLLGDDGWDSVSGSIDNPGDVNQIRLGGSVRERERQRERQKDVLDAARQVSIHETVYYDTNILHRRASILLTTSPPYPPIARLYSIRPKLQIFSPTLTPFFTGSPACHVSSYPRPSGAKFSQ